MSTTRKIMFLFLVLALMTPVRASEVVVTQTTMQNAQSTGNGTVVGAAAMSKCRETAIYLVPSAGITSGAVTIESAHDAAFTGTWAPMGSALSLVASTEQIVQITGVHLNLRARISTTVVGGTVTAILVCN